MVDSVLTSRDALDNIAEIRKRIESQKSVVDSQLQAATEAQAQLLVNGITALDRVQEKVANVKQSMASIHSASDVSKNAVENFPQIQRLHSVVKNFELTRMFLDNFQSMGAKLDEINAMLDDPRGQYEEYENIYFPWLLPIHKKLDDLRVVQAQALRYASSCSEDVRITIKRHFAPLTKTVQRFDHALFEIPMDLLELARGEPTLVVRLAKIIDYEERKELLAEQGVNSANGGIQYPKRMLHVIEKTTIEKFEAYQENIQEPEQQLEKFVWVVNDLKIVQRYLVKLMPQRWDILNNYVRFYHKQIYETVKKILASDPSAALILQLLEWTKNYYIKMKELFGVAKEDLEPPLLDGQEKQLYDNFLEHLVEKLHEWYRTVAIQEKKPFIQRTGAPDCQADGTACLNTHMDMNQLVSQQLNAAAESNQSRIVLGCVSACCDLLMQRQREWSKLVDEEVAKEIKGSVEEIPPGLFEYLSALANEQDRGQDFLDDIAQKWTESLSRKYQAQAHERFDQAGEGFLDVAKRCIDGMIELIMNDLKAAFVDLFVSKSWKKGVTIHQICTTIGEYLEDASALLHPDLFDTLLQRLCRAVVLQYLRGMSHAHGKIKPEEGRERILEDVKQVHEAFTTEKYTIDAESATHYFGVFGPLVDTLVSPIDELSARFIQLREDYWDAPLDLFENMIAVRKDIDKKVLKELTAKIRMLAVQSQDKSGEHQPTFLHGFK